MFDSLSQLLQASTHRLGRRRHPRLPLAAARSKRPQSARQALRAAVEALERRTLLSGNEISLSGTPDVLAGNLLVNGGFETGDMTGWYSSSGDTEEVGTDGQAIAGVMRSGAVVNARTGNYAIYDAASAGLLIHQDVEVTPGESYAVGYFTSLGGAQGEAYPWVQISVNGSPVVENQPGQRVLAGQTPANFVHVGGVITVPAGVTSIQVMFGFQAQIPWMREGLSFDDFYVTPVTAALTEGSTYSLTVDASQNGVGNYRIDWGDGTAPQVFAVGDSPLTASHVYADGPANHSIKVADVASPDIVLGELPVAVVNTPPEATLVAPTTATRGEVVTISVADFQDSAPDLQTGLQYRFSTSQWNGWGANTWSDSPTAEFWLGEDGPVEVFAEIRDRDGASRVLSAIVDVAPSAAAPVLWTRGTGKEGDLHTLFLSRSALPAGNYRFVVGTQVLAGQGPVGLWYMGGAISTALPDAGPTGDVIPVRLEWENFDPETGDNFGWETLGTTSITVTDASPTVELARGFNQELMAKSLLTNGGFETGNAQGWTIIAPPSFAVGQHGMPIIPSYDPSNSVMAHGGEYAAFTTQGSPDDPAIILSQTVTVVPGQRYSIGYFSGPGDSSGSIFVNGEWIGPLEHGSADADGFAHVRVGWTPRPGVTSATVTYYDNYTERSLDDFYFTPDTTDEGSTFALTLGPVKDPVRPSGGYQQIGDDTVTAYVINWGDGTAAQHVPVGDLAPDRTLHHTYAVGTAAGAPRAISVSVVDEDGTHTGAGTSAVTVNLAMSITGPSTGVEAAGISFNTTASQPNDGTRVYTWNLTRDGVPANNLGSSFNFGSSFGFNAADNGTYVLSVSMIDGAGRTGSATKTVMIQNVAPIPTILGPSVGTEGTPIHLPSQVIEPIDAIVRYDWTVTKNGQTYYSASGPTFITLLPNDDGSYVVTLTVEDDDGGVATTTRTITVSNVAPTLSLSGANAVAEGSLYSLTLGQVIDPGADTATTFLVDWGDGTGFAHIPAANLAPNRIVTHIFPDGPLSPTITVRVTDEDGTHVAGTKTVQVTNVAPSLTLAGAATVDEGSAYTLTLGPVSDPGADAVSEYRINWGDGLTSTVAAAALPPDRRITHVYADGDADGTSRSIVMDLVDEDGLHTARGEKTLAVHNVAPALRAPTATLVKDINTQPGGLTISAPVNVNGTLFFSVGGALGDTELWKRDSISGEISRVKDINTGTGSSSPQQLTAVGGTLYFSASDGASGRELWKSDGTAAGTVRVKDINPGTGSSSPSNFTAVGGTIYFSANDGSSGSELWKSDGTAAGTVRVKDINAGSGFSSPQSLTAVGGTIYFSAYDSAGDQELWKSDGTAAGTVRVKDIYAGTGSSSPQGLTAAAGTLYFSASDGSSGWELWKSDGTDAGTVRVKDINAGSESSSPQSLTAVGGTIYFSAYESAGGRELWKSDGTTAGTVPVKDIYAGVHDQYYYNGYGGYTSYSVPNSSNPAGFKIFSGTLYFSAIDEAGGQELWKTDGTDAGTLRVKDINPGAGSSAPTGFTAVGDALYFSAYDGALGRELWKSDGTAAGTVRVRDIVTGSGSSLPGTFVVADGNIYFLASNAMGERGLWVSDGTEEGTRGESLASGTLSSRPQNLATVAGTLYFTAIDAAGGQELWKSDGTAAGTVRVKDINAGIASSSPQYLTAVGGTLYFVASEGSSGWELWKSDGTDAGTARVKDINAGSGSSVPQNLTAFGGSLYFSAMDADGDRELWKSDGTDAGTVRVKDIYAGTGSSSPQGLTAAAGTLYFSASDGSSGWELWKSDGTDAGTARVKDINAGSGSSSPQDLTAVGGTLYFSAMDADGDRELWKSDGTDAGTVRVKDIYAGTGSSSPQGLTAAAGMLYFWASDAEGGQELWKSDGTAAGTVRVKDINAGTASSSPRSLTAIGDTLYFTAYDGALGRELWKSDGTDTGTVRVKDINAGTGSSSPSNFTAVGSAVYFIAYNGNESALWSSNGSSAGTRNVSGGLASEPSWLAAANDALYFAATDADHGRELWRFGHGSSDVTLSGNATVNEGAPYHLTLGAVVDPGDDSVVSYLVEWGDGTTSTVSAAALAEDRTLVHSYPDGGATHTIRVSMTDEDGTYANLGTKTVHVNNVAPNVTVIAPDQGTPSQALEFTFHATDASAVDEAAGFAYHIDWNGDDVVDEVIEATPGNGAGVTVAHAFGSTGSHNVQVIAVDKDGNRGSATDSVSLDTALLDANGNLIIGGTANADRIVIVHGSVLVYLDDILVARYDNITGNVVVLGGDGDDHIEVDPMLDVSTVLVGGDGNDVIKAGGGNSVLVGGAGNDTLFGGPGLNTIVATSGSGTNTYISGGGTVTVEGGDGVITPQFAPTLGTINATAGPTAVNNVMSFTAPYEDLDLGLPVGEVLSASWEWGDGSTSAGTVATAVTGTHAYSAAGVYTVKLTLTDSTGASATASYKYAVVYDPSGGFVTGGGWINSPAGAMPANPTAAGKASFGFVSKYHHGANTPTGVTEFAFQMGNLNFRSTSYDWLVIGGARAQYKGRGTINGQGDYGFLISVVDGQMNGGGGTDKFRIKIWNRTTGAIMYDNQMGADDNAPATTALGGGSIVIHAA